MSDQPSLREARSVSVALDTFLAQMGKKPSNETDDLTQLLTAVTKVASTFEGAHTPKRAYGFDPAPTPPPPPGEPDD